MEWVEDDKGNKCSVEHFGGEAEARAALESLKNCERCINCSDCSGCSGCSGCDDCYDCSRCSGCSGCYVCSGCSGCSGCDDCSGCSDCSRCYDCSRCSGMKGTRPQEGVNTVPPVPVIDNIHQRVFEAASAPNALNMDSWHTCETTHCRAGWVVALAGEAGKALERFHDTPLAASLIYQASSPLPVSMARFFDRDEGAMSDMKRLAELERQATTRTA